MHICAKNLVIPEEPEQYDPSRYTATTLLDEEGVYEIVVKGHLAEHWSAWLGELTIHHDDQGNTRLAGAITDQAALHGILAQIRDLGLSLLSVNRAENAD